MYTNLHILKSALVTIVHGVLVYWCHLENIECQINYIHKMTNLKGKDLSRISIDTLCSTMFSQTPLIY